MPSLSHFFLWTFHDHIKSSLYFHSLSFSFLIWFVFLILKRHFNVPNHIFVLSFVFFVSICILLLSSLSLSLISLNMHTISLHYTFPFSLSLLIATFCFSVLVMIYIVVVFQHLCCSEFALFSIH